MERRETTKSTAQNVNSTLIVGYGALATLARISHHLLKKAVSCAINVLFIKQLAQGGARPYGPAGHIGCIRDGCRRGPRFDTRWRGANVWDGLVPSLAEATAVPGEGEGAIA